MITVIYSDGQECQYKTIEEAKEEIRETVFGCDFAVTVDSIEEDGEDLYITWDLHIERG